MSTSFSPFIVADPVDVEEVEAVFEDEVPPFEDVPLLPVEDFSSEDDDEFEVEIPAEVSGSISDVNEDIAGVSRQESLETVKFEGHAVASAELVVALKLSDLPHVTIDDRVHIVADIRIREVLHKSNAQGDIIRVVKAKQDEAYVAPFVEGEDDGVIRRS